VVAVAAALGAAVVAAVLVLTGGTDRVAEQASPPAALPERPPADPGAPAPTPAPAPGQPPEPADPAEPVEPVVPAEPVVPVACPAEVSEAICDAAAFVQREAGRAFHRFPTVELEDDAGFRARLLADFDEGVEDLEALGATLTAMGMIDPGTDVVAAVADLLSVAVVGFYDPETEELVVRGGELTPYTRIVVVHELVHALDDQWFELHRPEYEERDDEVGFGFLAVLEGHAGVIEDRYRQALSPAEQRQAVQEEIQLVMQAGIDVFALPPVLLELLVAPYGPGQRLVERILAEQGPDGLAAAFADPPTTSSQVLHPELYFAREPAVEVPAPPADGEVVDEGVVGELVLGLWLGSAEVATGWGGDRYVTWRQGSGWCFRTDVVMRTEADLARLRAAVERWVAQAPDRRTVQPLDPADLPTPGLRATGC
jgi:hypothetical protein